MEGGIYFESIETHGRETTIEEILLAIFFFLVTGR
jgi:hypothetical protein